jgi:Ca2+-binding EF-hand superfamily protein
MRCNHPIACSSPNYRSTGSTAKALAYAGWSNLAGGLLAVCLATWLTPSSLAAQVLVPEPAQVQPRKFFEGRYKGTYDESTSRELFRACDANSDDRLDIFETADAFEVLASPRDLQGFARLDSDRDGYLTWPEFDQRFQKGLEHGGTFTVKTCRPYVLPEPPPQPLTPLQKFIKLYDKDEDGGLSPTEITDLLKATGLPEAVGGILMQSDLDKSGKVEEAELAPWFQNLPKPAETDKSSATTSLKQPWLDADANLDQAIDAAELTALLRRLDPGLLRWTKSLIQKLDGNKDNKLSATELAKTEPPAPATQAPAAPPAGTRPSQAPLR